MPSPAPAEPCEAESAPVLPEPVSAAFDESPNFCSQPVPSYQWRGFFFLLKKPKKPPFLPPSPLSRLTQAGPCLCGRPLLCGRLRSLLSMPKSTAPRSLPAPRAAAPSGNCLMPKGEPSPEFLHLPEVEPQIRERMGNVRDVARALREDDVARTDHVGKDRRNLAPGLGEYRLDGAALPY